MVGELTAGSYSTPINPPAAKFASQGDVHVRTDAQIKSLYYPLACPPLFKIFVFPPLFSAPPSFKVF